MKSQSLWLEQAAQSEGLSPLEPLRDTKRADVCVVGGGFAGLWTAVRASGRNGGFMMSWWSKLGTLVKVVGMDEALRLARASAEVPAEVEAFCRRESIDAHLQRRGWIWAASNAAQVGAWDDLMGLLEQSGEAPFVPLSRDELDRLTGSAALRAGVYEATCATLHPALLVRGLVRAALGSGVQIFEHSPMTGLAEGRPCRVSTAAGEIHAEKVVLALGAWTAAHVRSLARMILIVASDMVATAPAPAELDELGAEAGLAVSDSRLLVNYWHRTADDRIAFGTAGGALAFGHRIGDRFEGSSPRAEEITRNLRKLYPQLSAEVTHNWTGPIDRSVTGLPSVVPVGFGDRIWAVSGFSGNGVGPSFLIARVLAALALDYEDAWSASGLVARPLRGFPPEPVRFVGGQLVRRAVAAKERTEDRGGTPSRVARSLAALAPAGLVPTPKGPDD
jgi:glycine/D-amino acid oxidase-like deaminating enzyme